MLSVRVQLLSGLIALLLTGCGDSPPGETRPFLNVGEAVEYVGDAACASCHAGQYEGFQSHGMANSFYPMSADHVVEDFPGPVIEDPNAGYHYQAVRRGNRFFQVETLLDADGQEIHRLEREMKFVMGSGTAARTYFDDSQGFLYEMPLTWYTQEERWDFSPGYRKANKRFDRTVPDRCMACHNSYPESVAHADGKYAEIPEGIGCERCHGPGALHVSRRRAVPEPASDIDSTIVNPAHLTQARRLDVCQQCHLHTTVSLLKEGRGPFEFKPSHALEDYLALYASTQPSSDTQIGVISHADRMTSSACYVETLASGANFECTTCHNPHQGFREHGPDYFNATCQSCHGQADLPPTADHVTGANCIDCHMPKVESSEAPHSSFTDHRIRVVSSRDANPTTLTENRPSLNADDGQASRATDQLISYHGQEDPAYQAMAYVILGRQTGDAALLRRGADMLDELAARDELRGEAEFLRGFARMQLGSARSALPALEAAVEADPNIPERLNALAQAYESLGRSSEAIETLYRRAVDVQPARADIWVNYGRFLEASGRLDEALSAYERGADEQPWLFEAVYNLGTAQARTGRAEEGLRTLRRAARLEPRDPSVWGNIGALYGQLGKPDSTRFAFEHAVSLAPNNAVALGNLGAFYLNQGEFNRAIQYLDRAVTQDPGFADAIANRALAHLQLGERASARLYARRALEAAPGHSLATQILQTLNRP